MCIGDSNWCVNHEGRRLLVDYRPFRVPEDVPMPDVARDALRYRNGVDFVVQLMPRRVLLRASRLPPEV